MKKKVLKRVPCAKPLVPSSADTKLKLDAKKIVWFYPTERSYIPELPVLRCDDGSLWKEGVGFLISRLYDKDFNRSGISVSTVSRKADDLAFYKNGLEYLQIDIRADERFKSNRPTYAFLNLLESQVTAGELADSSACRIIGTVVEYHRWESFEFKTNRLYPLWEEITRKRRTIDDRGVNVSTSYTTTDLAETISKARLPDDPNYIMDCGKLKPLTLEQQSIVITALHETKNTEMYLGFLISLATSARIQTVFTLRANSFTDEIADTQEFVRVHTGQGTNVDTKRNKKHYLDFPAWLYKKIHCYVHSERYLNRREKCKLPKPKQYVFYTTQGNPYYTSASDEVSEKKDGSAVRVFMTERLFPTISRLGHSFRFKFHDLRATYCSNRLEEGLDRVECGETTLDAVMRGLQDAMGHSDIRTTYRYLDYRNLNPIIGKTNLEWTGKLLMDIIIALELKDGVR